MIIILNNMYNRYCILNPRELIESINSLPTIREVDFNDIIEIRKSIYQGAYICKLLAQKSFTNKHAVKLFYNIMEELCNNNNLNKESHNVRKIILCRGIQGSGKSTFARNWTLEDPEHRVRFNNDDIRNMLGKYWVPSREKIVSALKKEFLYSAMTHGYDIIVDNMNLNPKEVEYFQALVDRWNNPNGVLSGVVKVIYEVEFKNFKTPLKVCIERDSKRENPIGKETITSTYNKYKDFYSSNRQ